MACGGTFSCWCVQNGLHWTKGIFTYMNGFNFYGKFVDKYSSRMEHMGYEKPIEKVMSWFGVQFGSLEMLWQMKIHEINWTIFIKLVKPREIHTLRESFTTPNYDDNEDDDEEDVPLPRYPPGQRRWHDGMTAIGLLIILTYPIAVY